MGVYFLTDRFGYNLSLGFQKSIIFLNGNCR